MCQGVDGKVFPYRRSGDSCVPAKGKVNRGEAYLKVPGGVLGHEGGEEGEGLWECGRGRVGVRGGAGNTEGAKSPPVPAGGNNRGEAGLASWDRGQSGEKVIPCPSFDPVPEAVHVSECSVVWGEEVGSVGEYGQEEAVGNAVAEEGSDASPWGGEGFAKGEDGVG